MHDVIARPKRKLTKKRAASAPAAAADFPTPRRVGEIMAAAGPVEPIRQIFDAFWREGELALLFGPSGVGKSLLAVQLADALSSGRVIGGFQMPITGRNTLYVDLVMSDLQFKRRYMVRSEDGKEAKSYKFPHRFFRGRPNDLNKFAEWLRLVIKRNNYRAVIIDDLSAIKRTHDGTRETLALMLELKRIKDETGVSILVIARADLAKKGGLTDERDLGRSRVLADVADSVFSLGFHRRDAAKRCLVQTRSRNAPIVWNESNAPVCTVETTEAGILGLSFDSRFSGIDDETRELICKVHRLRTDGGLKLKDIAEQLEISTATVSRMLKRWSPTLEKAGEGSSGGSEEANDDDEWTSVEEEQYLREIGQAHLIDRDRPHRSNRDLSSGEPRGPDLGRIPFGAGMSMRSVYDLPSYTDKFGVTYYVEEYQHHTNRPLIFYHVNKQGNIVKHVRKLNWIVCQNLGPAPWLPRQ